MIATALPGSRSDALDVLAHIVNREMIRSPAARDLSIALTGRRLGCETQAFEIIEQARFDDALALARGCGATHPQLQALLGLGRFDEAAELGDRWRRLLYASQGVDTFVLERSLANIAAGMWVSFRNLDAEHRGAGDGAMALVTRDGAQLASALTNPRPMVSAGLSAMMGWLALRRDLARAIGDTALAQRTEDILAPRDGLGLGDPRVVLPSASRRRRAWRRRHAGARRQHPEREGLKAGL